MAITALAAPFLAGLTNREAGVPLGVDTASFRDLRKPGGDAVNGVIEALVSAGARECELHSDLVEPLYGMPDMQRHMRTAMGKQMARRDLRNWRTRTPLSHFESVRQRFAQAGIAVTAYNYSIDRSFSDEEIDRGFKMAKALGARMMTASMPLDVARRVAPAADRQQMIVAITSRCRPAETTEIATPADIDSALKLSRYFRIGADIGRLTSDNLDAVDFIGRRHAEIASVHLKDCRRDAGGTVPWGQGDTPIREALQLLKREGWAIPAFVDYEYEATGGAVQEIQRCLAFAKRALESR